MPRHQGAPAVANRRDHFMKRRQLSGEQKKFVANVDDKKNLSPKERRSGSRIQTTVPENAFDREVIKQLAAALGGISIKEAYRYAARLALDAHNPSADILAVGRREVHIPNSRLITQLAPSSSSS